MKTRSIFCALCQTDTDHTLEVDGNTEVVATCGTCGSFLKFPSGLSAEELIAQFEAQRAANEGQVTAVEAAAQLAAAQGILDQVADGETAAPKKSKEPVA